MPELNSQSKETLEVFRKSQEALRARKLGVTRRLNELRSMRFVEVRNLAYLNYAILGYAQTLGEREFVFSCIVQHELRSGYVIPDHEDSVFLSHKSLEDSKRSLIALQEANERLTTELKTVTKRLIRLEGKNKRRKVRPTTRRRT